MEVYAYSPKLTVVGLSEKFETESNYIDMKNKTERGLTLVEVMILVVIGVLLLSMAIPAFQKIREASQDKAEVENLRQATDQAQVKGYQDQRGFSK